jgi:hypothetical protein
MRKAQYIRLKKNGLDEPTPALDKYFKDSMSLDRKNMVRLLKDMNKNNVNNVNYDELESRPDFDQGLRTALSSSMIKDRGDGSLITTDYSYNIAHMPEYEAVTYHQLILPFVRHRRNSKNNLVD